MKSSALIWKTVKPFLSNKGSFEIDIKLVEKMDQGNSKWIRYKKKTISTLDIYEYSFIINHNSKNIVDPTGRVIEIYKYHPSIICLKAKVEGNLKEIK